MAETIVEPIEQYGLSQKAKPKTLFSKIGVVGCGLQGSHIARMVSAAGMDVIFIELSEDKIKEAYQLIKEQLDNMIERWGMTESEKRGILTRIKGSTNWKDLQGTDLVIEAVKSQDRDRRIAMRKEIFKKIENFVAPDTIIASNTTTIAITELSSELKHQDRCVSMHFFTASTDAHLVEVARGLHTEDEICRRIRKFITMLNKQIISIEESAGLISVRLTVSMVNEACDLYVQGISSMEDIDKSMRLGLGLRFGPFEIADKVGIDKVLRWMDNLYSEFGDKKFKASPLIRKLARANYLGRKTGRGFYKYDEKGKRITEPVHKI